MTFSVRIAVRGYELDTQGHLNNVVYHQYGDHARWECLRAAGVGGLMDLRPAAWSPTRGNIGGRSRERPP
ncbi:acyl-CoA thioesterase [Nonomuraea sp. NPDC052265]|uniref:acyl-CoA thioesterase n=1 Tax=Nonomuraea sp. NPDC052265 TaxID=3364374 RepID=UPI0037C9CFC4